MRTKQVLVIFAKGTLPASAQTTENPIKQEIKEETTFNGYTIGILPAEEGTGFGYLIYQEAYVVLVQKKNPFTFDKKGLTRKEDVYKVAKWQISQLKPGEKWPTEIPKPISLEVAKQLSIEIN